MSALKPGARRPIFVHAQDGGAAVRGHGEGFGGADPMFRGAGEDAGDIGGHAHGLEHVLVVGGGGAVCADADFHPLREGGADVGDAAAEAQIGAGVMRDGDTACGEDFEFFRVQPDAVRGAYAGAEQAETVQVVREGHAVTAESGFTLHGGFGEMGLQREIVVSGERGAFAQERVRAVQRNGGADPEADAVAVERPVVCRRPDLVKSRFCTRAGVGMPRGLCFRGQGVRIGQGWLRRNCDRRSLGR